MNISLVRLPRRALRKTRFFVRRSPLATAEGINLLDKEVNNLPSEKILNEKKEKVRELAEKLSGAAAVVLVDYKGINVDNDTKLRAELRAENVHYTVVKNTILSRACQDSGLEDLIPVLSGTTALALSDDEVAPARIIQKYVSRYRDIFNFKMGYVSGKVVGPDELRVIAQLPSREGLVAQVAGSFSSIISSLARAVSEVQKKMEESAA